MSFQSLIQLIHCKEWTINIEDKIVLNYMYALSSCEFEFSAEMVESATANKNDKY